MDIINQFLPSILNSQFSIQLFLPDPNVEKTDFNGEPITDD